MTVLFFFSYKQIASCHDLEPSNLKFELAQDIIIPKIYVKLCLKPLIYAGTRAMTKFFSKNSHNDFDFDPSTLKVELARDIIIPNICMK